jgi:UDP-N-acetylmuramoyl-tripeptide--D-alanyl-D-alanine ligase
MAELGEKEIEYHQEIGNFLAEKIKENVVVITVGNLANEITQRLNERGFSSNNFGDNLQTSRYILDNMKIGTTIILKASRSMKFEEIIDGVNSKQ